jgi:hypothetical protein
VLVTIVTVPAVVDENIMWAEPVALLVPKNVSSSGSVGCVLPKMFH